MTRSLILIILTMGITMGIGLSACSSEYKENAEKPDKEGTIHLERDNDEARLLPSAFQTGEKLFTTFCQRCHGHQGRGSSQGPPLVHKIYEPSHHGDHAFIRAAARGVRAHHWDFGNMPKIPEVTPGEVKEIVQYIRWLQQQAGIS
ncbi:MAG: c-type cytochrome [Nitrospirales bacterium]|nr:c-type cytochrome [Nitrospirales bacterium]